MRKNHRARFWPTLPSQSGSDPAFVLGAENPELSKIPSCKSCLGQNMVCARASACVYVCVCVCARAYYWHATRFSLLPGSLYFIVSACAAKTNCLSLRGAQNLAVVLWIFARFHYCLRDVKYPRDFHLNATCQCLLFSYFALSLSWLLQTAAEETA